MGKKMYAMSKEECECGLTEFYDNVARRMGFDNTVDLQYDCRKICITKSIDKCIWQHCFKEGMSGFEISAMLLSFGPKANLERLGYYVEVEDGFIIAGGDK